MAGGGPIGRKQTCRLDTVTAEMVVEGIRMKFSRVYAVQIMLAAELRHMGNLLLSHFPTFAHGNEYKSRTIYVELEPSPKLARRKETFLTLRSWLRGVVGGDVKAHWQSYQISHPELSRRVFGGVHDNNRCYVTSAAATAAGVSLEELQQELNEIFS